MMNSKTLKAMTLGAAVAAALSSGVASAELTGNAAAASNYVWRGVTQTADQAAVMGGIDWGHDSGIYVGTWASNVDFSDIAAGEYGKGYELDFYAGFGGEVGSFGYDLGVITYAFPITPEFNFTELYLSGTFNVLTIGVNYTADAASGNENGGFDKGDIYAYGSLDFETKVGDISLYAGSYAFDNHNKFGNGELDYSHYGASLSKGDFAFIIDKNDIDDPVLKKVRVSVMWGKEFELL